MRTMNAGRKTLLALAISSAMVGWGQKTYALDITSDTTFEAGEVINETLAVTADLNGSGAKITNNGEIKGDLHAIHITGKGRDITNSGLIQANKGAAIYLAEGAKFSSGNLAIKNTGEIIGGTLESGEQVAIDFSNMVGTVARGLELGYMNKGGRIEGNIYLNATDLGNISKGKATNTTNIEIHGSSASKAIMDLTKVSGASIVNIKKDGYLVLEAQDETIVFDLADYYSNASGGGVTENNGSFTLNENSVMEIQLNGSNKNSSTPILLVNGEIFVSNNGAKIKVTGDIETIQGEYTLIKADNIDGFNNITFTDTWLTKTELIENENCSSAAGTCDSIKVEVTYKEEEDITPETLSNWAKSGGADATEQAVIKAFGNYIETGMTVTEDSITFATRTQAELAGLIGLADADSSARLSGELTPDRSGATIHAAQRAQNNQFDAINNRLNTLRADQFHVVNATRSGLWMRVHGNDAKKNVDERIDGYDVQGMGFSFGIDGDLTENLVTGLSFGQSYQDIDTIIYDTKHEVNTYQFSAYGLWNHDTYFATASVNAGVDYYESERTIGASVGYTGETSANADYKAFHYGLRMTAGMDLAFDNLLVQPIIAGELSHVNIEDYTETGSPARYTYDTQSVRQVKLGAGVNLNTNFEVGSGILTPYFTTMGWYDFNADNHTISGHVVVDPTIAGTINTATGSTEVQLNLAAGFDYTIDGGLSLGLGLQHDFVDDGHDTQLQARMNYAF